MLSEFKCKRCQAIFYVALKGPPQPNNPIRHCVCCGNGDLEFLSDEEELAVRVKKVIDEYHKTFL